MKILASLNVFSSTFETPPASKTPSFYGFHADPFRHKTYAPFRPNQPETPNKSGEFKEHTQHPYGFGASHTSTGYYTGRIYPTEPSLPMAHSSIDSWDVPGLNNKVSPELSDLLSLEYYKSENSSSDLSVRNHLPRWPVTNSRAAHVDNDVFIGRANNPFGHSTKWKLK